MDGCQPDRRREAVRGQTAGARRAWGGPGVSDERDGWCCGCGWLAGWQEVERCHALHKARCLHDVRKQHNHNSSSSAQPQGPMRRLSGGGGGESPSSSSWSVDCNERHCPWPAYLSPHRADLPLVRLRIGLGGSSSSGAAAAEGAEGGSSSSSHDDDDDDDGWAERMATLTFLVGEARPQLYQELYQGLMPIHEHNFKDQQQQEQQQQHDNNHTANVITQHT